MSCLFHHAPFLILRSLEFEVQPMERSQSRSTQGYRGSMEESCSRSGAQIRRLAASGFVFTHCFHQGSWSGAVCVYGRTILNTGLTAFRAQQHDDEVQTWGQTRGGAGYDTYICGKWHLSSPLLGRGFREMGPIGPAMFISTPEKGPAYDRPSPGNTWQPDVESQRGHWVSAALWRSAVPDRTEHACSVYADVASDFLTNQLAHRDKSFFMYVGFNSPHDPRQSPKEYLDLYPQDKIEIPPNYLPEHPFDHGDARVRDEMLAPFPRTKRQSSSIAVNTMPSSLTWTHRSGESLPRSSSLAAHPTHTSSSLPTTALPLASTASWASRFSTIAVCVCRC